MSSDLKASSKRVGRLYPILLDKHGDIIDGRHRFVVDESWPKMRLEKIETEEQKLVARLVSNVCRRRVSAEEKTDLLEKLGQIYLNEGVERGNITYKIAEKTGMSCRWVTKYLPDKFKDLLQSKRASSAERRSAGEDPKRSEELIIIRELTAPSKEKFLKVKNYANTKFVNIVLEKRFYMRVEKIAEKLGSQPDIIINNTLLLAIKRLESIKKTR